MREIKFRAWAYKNIGDSGGIHRPKVEPSNPQMYFNVEDCYDSQWESFGEVLKGGFSHEVLAVMQFTGLKDKNGKEIYEGDIVLMKTNGGIRIKGDVFFKDGEFRCGNHSLIGFVIDPVGCSIVGNIYENPELLKGVEP